MRKVPSNGSFTLSCVEHARRDPVRRGPYPHLARAVHRIRIAPPRFGASDTGSDTRSSVRSPAAPASTRSSVANDLEIVPVERQSGRPKVFQYTAINDYTRNEVFRLYTQKTRGPAICFYTTTGR